MRQRLLQETFAKGITTVYHNSLSSFSAIRADGVEDFLDVTFGWLYVNIVIHIVLAAKWTKVPC